MKISPLFLLLQNLRCADEQLHTGDLCNSNSHDKVFIAPSLALTGLRGTFSLVPSGRPLLRQHGYHTQCCFQEAL